MWHGEIRALKIGNDAVIKVQILPKCERSLVSIKTSFLREGKSTRQFYINRHIFGILGYR